MEEVSKDAGHRPSVSMPSLDATDDFPTQTVSAEITDDINSAFVNTADSFVSTASTETIVSSSEHTDVPCTESVSYNPENSAEAIQSAEDQPLPEKDITEALIDEGTSETSPENASAETLVGGATTEPLIDETSTSAEPLVEGVTDESLTTETTPIIGDTLTEPLIEGVSTEPLIEGIATEPLLGVDSEVLNQEDDSQGEEDPSIAIDQFIKKIADEQLSSKRIEERKEEEAKEQFNEAGDSILGVEEETKQSNENNMQDEISQPPAEPSSLENTLEGETSLVEKQVINSEPPTEPMEVENNINEDPTQKFDASEVEMTEKTLNESIESEDQLQMESIEEIQKEINRIPAKKSSSTEDVAKAQKAKAFNGTLENAGTKEESQTQESIEQILGEDISKLVVTPQVDILKTAVDKEVKMPGIQDSSDVAKDPKLIEKAQEEMRKLDVLVCGECHNTFYHTQEFGEHKQGKCPKKSVLSGICEMESKPQVWGFILWKMKHKKDLGENTTSSWAIYQRWCKLPQADKNAWITAGQAIQFASKIGNAKITEVRPTRQTKQVVVHKVMDKEQPPPIEFVDSNKENSSSLERENTPTNIMKKGISRPVRLNNDVTILPSSKVKNVSSASAPNIAQSDSNKAVRTTKVLSAQKEEYVVEKIMAKRFNPRKKTWEYNIKWENFGHDSNTWEPVSNLDHCSTLLEQFEEQLRRMKEEKAKQAAQSPKGRGRPSNPKPTPNKGGYVPIAPKLDAGTPRISNVVGGVSDDYAGGSASRPTRSCKQKAMNQVKQWIGNISDDDSGGGGLGIKRRHDSDDSDEDYDAKKIKMEQEDSDYSDKEFRELKPKISIKKVTSTPKPVKNGNMGAQQILPSNILIPDANGVVRINQKQLPSLSSGVYIMSKTAGIIKLDSTTSKVATSGGQTIVKVAPKIGQTQIKIVKKDGNTTKQIIQVTPKPDTHVKLSQVKSTPKYAQKVRKDIRKAPPLTEPASISKQMKKPELSLPTQAAAPSQEDSESDDGLEPLPFPGPEEPIPDMEDIEAEGDFDLDPLTGKLAGVEYVDKPVVIKEELPPAPPTTNDLENIVKLAAAEITESDSQHSDGQMELDDPLFETKDVKPKIVQQSLRSEPNSGGMVRKVVKYTTAHGMKTESSILNKALSQAGGPKAVISPVKASTPVQVRPRAVQQRILNQMISRTPQQTRTVVRHVISPQRPSGGNMNVVRKTIPSTGPRPRFNLAPQRPLPSPLQPTRTYSAMGGLRQHNSGAGSKVQVYSTSSGAAGVQQQQPGGIRRIGNTIVRTSSSGQANAGQKPLQSYPAQKPVTRIVQRVVTSPKKASETQPIINRSVTQAQRIVPSAKPKPIISMPSLTDLEDLDPPISTPTKIVQKAQTAPQQPKAVPQLARPTQVKQETPIVAKKELPDQAETAEGEANAEAGTDWSSFTMADGENPIYVTGDDGTIYQVAGQNEQGQTILITQGPDGQQQCLLVTSEIGEVASEEQPSTSAAEASAETETAESEETNAATQDNETTEEAATETTTPVPEDSLHTPLQIKTDTSEMEGIEEGSQDQVIAQVVRAEPPSPGGTHKVVVMLPDGNLMVTQVSPEEYASLELE